MWEGNESDGLLHPTAEMTAKAGGEDFYKWEYELNQNGEIFMQPITERMIIIFQSLPRIMTSGAIS